MATYSFWQSKTVAQLSSITDGVTDADKAYMEANPFDQIAAMFSELGSGPSGSLIDLTVRLAVSLQADGDLIPGSVTLAIDGQDISVNDLFVSGITSFNAVQYTWTGSDGGAGDVLTTDGGGSLTWTTPTVSSPLWTQSGNDIYYPSGGVGVAGNVGIGSSSSPSHRFTVQQTGSAFVVLNNAGTVFFEVDTSLNTITAPTVGVTTTIYTLEATNSFDVGSGSFTVNSVGNTDIADDLKVDGHTGLGAGATPSSNLTFWIHNTLGAGGTVYNFVNQLVVSGANTDVYGQWNTVGTSAAVALTNIYNLRITEGSKTPGTTITNQYGVLIGTLNDASNNWGIWCETDSVFTGTLKVGPDSAFLNASHGFRVEVDQAFNAGLEVVNINSNGFAAASMDLRRTATGVSGHHVGIFNVTGKDTAGNIHQYANVIFSSEIATSGGEMGQISLYVAESGVDTQEYLRISANNTAISLKGNILPLSGDDTGQIGDTSDRFSKGYFADSVSSGATVAPGTSGAYVYRFVAHSTAAEGVYSQWTNSATGTGADQGFVIGIDSTGQGILYNNEAQNILFYTAGVQAMIIETGTEFLGIGPSTTTPAYRIDTQGVASNEAYRISTDVVDGAVWFIWNNDARTWWGGVRTDDYWALWDQTGANYRLIIATNGDISGTHGTYHISSDERLKTNVVPIENALATVCQMEGVHYNWITPPYKREGKQTGMIAQQIYGIASELTQTADDEMATMSIKDDISVDAYLVEAIKELKLENDDLRAEIEILKAI
jgi:hypothetical protein